MELELHKASKHLHTGHRLPVPSILITDILITDISVTDISIADILMTDKATEQLYVPWLPNAQIWSQSALMPLGEQRSRQGAQTSPPGPRARR